LLSAPLFFLNLKHQRQVCPPNAVKPRRTWYIKRFEI
jgi:hypothetical protein